MRYQGIKVTVVTGFLGAGKTTLIRHLLSQSPPHERWAVLVNEFGDIGLDGAFYADLGVAITEIPGGCVCCTTSAAFQKGLNQLIRQYNPDRIFIEPSGLGHPKQIIQKLRSATYQDVLLLTGTFCVLDARNLKDTRYTQHDMFNEQISAADGIVFSHLNCYDQEDFESIKAHFGDLNSAASSPELYLSDPMKLSVDSLDIGLNEILNITPTLLTSPHHVSHKHLHSDAKVNKTDEPWSYHKQQGEMQVIGWSWPNVISLDQAKVTEIIAPLSKLDGVYRVKGVIRIDATEALFVNIAKGDIVITRSIWKDNSRLEIIGGMETGWLESARTAYAQLF